MFLRIQAAKKDEVIQLKKVCWGGGGGSQRKPQKQNNTHN